MKMPTHFLGKPEWAIVGPMGPMLPKALGLCPSLVVDGGAHFSERLDIWIGDHDSTSKEINCPYAFHYPKDKSLSDLGLAFQLFTEYLPYKLHLWGFLGGRKDHELFNLGEALSFLETHAHSQILFYDSTQKVRFNLFGKGKWTFFTNGLFSLGSIRPVSIKLEGACTFPAPEETVLLPLSSLGLSNQGSGEIRLEAEGPVFVYFPESP